MTRKETDTARILVVEDNPADVAMIRRYLGSSRLDCELSVVHDGEQAIQFLEDRDKPDILLLDLNLPRVDGWEVLKKMKKCDEWRRIPVVVFTTSGYQEDIDRAYDLYANSYIIKPNNKDNFSHLIEVVEDYWFGVAELPSASQKG